MERDYWSKPSINRQTFWRQNNMSEAMQGKQRQEDKMWYPFHKTFWRKRFRTMDLYYDRSKWEKILSGDSNNVRTIHILYTWSSLLKPIQPLNPRYISHYYQASIKQYYSYSFDTDKFWYFLIPFSQKNIDNSKERLQPKEK